MHTHESKTLQIIWGELHICQEQGARVCGELVISGQVLALCCPFTCLQSCANAEAVCMRLMQGCSRCSYVAFLCPQSITLLAWSMDQHTGHCARMA